jgi:putative restriction endonuclease
VADDDEELRAAMIAFLSMLSVRNGGTVTWKELQEFRYMDRRIPLIGQTGIRRIKGHDAAFTILTTYRLNPKDRPYEDAIGMDGYPRYKWRGENSAHADNASLREAMTSGKPVAWFEGIESGIYLVHEAVWVVGEEPTQHQFVLALDETMRDQWQPDIHLSAADMALRREYADVVVKRRLHQPMFKRRVLKAYRTQCAICRLRVRELLEAAHIRADAQGGEPIVPNGIALCSIHHRAFDSLVVGVTPHYKIEVRRDVLGQQDGPTLLHSLQGVHGRVLDVPRRQEQRPDPMLLEERYERFLEAG